MSLTSLRERSLAGRMQQHIAACINFVGDINCLCCIRILPTLTRCREVRPRGLVDNLPSTHLTTARKKTRDLVDQGVNSTSGFACPKAGHWMLHRIKAASAQAVFQSCLYFPSHGKSLVTHWRATRSRLRYIPSMPRSRAGWGVLPT